MSAIRSPITPSIFSLFDVFESVISQWFPFYDRVFFRLSYFFSLTSPKNDDSRRFFIIPY